MLTFIIWAMCGVLFIGLGIYSFGATQALSFWSNMKVVPIKDVKSYNKAVGKLWCIFGLVFILLGLPLLAGQNSPLVLLSVLGCIFACIFLMITYIRIENKYRKK